MKNKHILRQIIHQFRLRYQRETLSASIITRRAATSSITDTLQIRKMKECWRFMTNIAKFGPNKWSSRSKLETNWMVRSIKSSRMMIRRLPRRWTTSTARKMKSRRSCQRALNSIAISRSATAGSAAWGLAKKALARKRGTYAVKRWRKQSRVPCSAKTNEPIWGTVAASEQRHRWKITIGYSSPSQAVISLQSAPNLKSST